MQFVSRRVIAVCAAALVFTGCGKEDAAAGAKQAAKKVAEDKPAQYSYPAPVKGHYKEVNIGEFDVVGGIAYTVPALAGATGRAG